VFRSFVIIKTPRVLNSTKRGKHYYFLGVDEVDIERKISAFGELNIELVGV